MPHEPKPRWYKPRNCFKFQMGRRIYYGTEAWCWSKIDDLKRNRGSDRVQTIAQAITAFTTLYPRREAVLKAFDDAYGMRLIDEVSTRDLAKLVAQLESAGKKPWTIRQYVGAAHSLLRWCQRQEYVSEIPAKPKMPPAHANPSPIDNDLLARILAALAAHGNQQALHVIRFRLETGCRPGEACGLRWAWLQPDVGADVGAHGTFRIPPAHHKTGEKTGTDRVLYLTAEARKIVDAQRRCGEFVFVSEVGRPYTVGGLRSAWRRATARVDPDLKLSSYKLRHMFGFLMRRQGVPVDVLSKLFNHRSLKTTQVYYSAEDSAALAAVGSVSVLAPAPPAPPARVPSSDSPTPPRRKTRARSPRQSASATNAPAGPSPATAAAAP